MCYSYGVGVTCVLPGAVKDTSFASRSEIEEAACFHFPGYAKTPELVASEGIKSLMLGYPESYPGWQNRAFVKMFLPMLPPRFSTMVGEWAWNPWQWGDVMPHRPGRSNREDPKLMVEQDDMTASSSISTPSSTADSAPTSPTWKFRRSSSSEPTNQMQLPDIPKSKASTKSSADVPSKSTSVELVGPVKDAVPVVDPNTTVISEETGSGNLGMKPEDPNNDGPSSSAATSFSGAQDDVLVQAVDDKSLAASEGGGKQMPQVADDDVKSQTEKGRVRSEKGDVVAQVPSTPKPLILPPPSTTPQQDDTQASPPLALFGFFDKDKSQAAASGEESTQMDDAKGPKDAITGRSGGAAAESSLPPDKARYPSMMDKNDYDFRDRRLDY